MDLLMPQLFKRILINSMMLSCLATGTAISAPSRPNIVLLVADDVGYSDIGAFGSEIETPNIDSLASQGMRLSNFHVTGSCAPTRATLLTGVDHHLAGIGNMVETTPLSQHGKPGYEGVLNDKVVTLPTLLGDAGYRTSIAGKWHLGHEKENLPPARGFDHSVIQADSGSDNYEMRPYLPMKSRAYWYEDGRELQSLPENFYSSTFFVDKTIDYLKQGEGLQRPFFAYVAFQANHMPIQAPMAFVDHYQGRYDQGWSVLREQRRERAVALGLTPADAPLATLASTRDWGVLSPEEKHYEARRMEAYAGMATAMDHEIGRLIEYLKQTGQYENTLFVFMSDNGAAESDPYTSLIGRSWLNWNYEHSAEHMGEKGSWISIGPSWASAANSPLNGYKFFASEGGIRVPLIITGPSLGVQAKTSQALTHIADIAPTILAVAGVEPPNGVHDGKQIERMHGSDLLPLLRGDAQLAYAPEQAISYELAGNSAVFQGNYKLLRNLAPLGDGEWHLYDLRTDPGEVNDLREQQPKLVAELQSRYRQYELATGTLPMPEGYLYTQQVQVNSFVFFYLPRLLGIIAGLTGLVIALRWLKRRTGSTKTG